MQKILLAIALVDSEVYIQDSLNNKALGEYEFVGTAIHKEALVEKMKATTPDIVVVREGLQGQENIFNLVCNLKVAFPNTRFIFIAGNRKPGDGYLNKLASFNIYDIIYGERTNINLVLDMILNPSTFAYASQFLTKRDDVPDDFETNVTQKEVKEEIVSITTYVEKPVEKPIEKKVPEKKPPVKKPPKPATDTTAVKSQERKEIEKLKKEIEQLKKQKEAPLKNNNVEVATIPPRAPKSDGMFGLNKNKYVQQFTGKDKIVTFFGAKNGLGTTTVAYNVALELAYRKKKVLYIEVNDKNPMIAYWYDVYSNLSLTNGIDKAILGFETGINSDIDNSIITKEELIKAGGPLSDDFKKFPPTLDYLFFSAEYIEAKNKQIISSNSFSQVLLYFMQQLNYNYLILDINTNMDQSIIETALTFSNKNFITITQEFSSIGYYERFFEILRRKGLDFSKKENGKKDLSEKNSFILNRYIQKAKFNLRTIKDWLNNPEVFIVTDNSKDIADLSFNCTPIIKNTTNKEFIFNIATIANNIESA